MGAVQSDLKATIVQASAGGRAINADDEDFWGMFWKRPETAEHVFETFTPTDIRGMRDDKIAFGNLKILILKSILRLLHHRFHATSLTEDNAKIGTEVLNCVRLLTRVLPYVYECDKSRQWEDETLWQPQSESMYKRYSSQSVGHLNSEPLGAQLISALTDFLFYSGFTLPWSDTDTQREREGRVSYGLWQSGIACDVIVYTSKEFESRRTEILQLLLTLESKAMYINPGSYITTEIPAITCITRLGDKRRIQSLLCSLLNTIIKYHPETWLAFDPRTAQTDSAREIHVKTCLHFLLVNILNRAPWEQLPKEKNEFRLQFSYLHKPKHFQFLADGMFKILRQPLEVNNNVLSMTQRPVAWAPEMVLLLWEALYTNRKYLHYVVESGRALDLLVLLIYYAKESHMEGIGRVCVFCLQTLSAEPGFGQMLNRPFDAHNTLPVNIQIKNFHGKYSDYFITSILSLLELSSAETSYWSISLTAVINNVAAEVTDLARATSSKLIHAFIRMSRPSFLLANDSNVVLLSNLLEAINSFIEQNNVNHDNSTLLYMIWRARENFERLREISLLDEEQLAVLRDAATSRPQSPVLGSDTAPSSPEKSRGKMPFVQGDVSFEAMRRLPSLPLHTCLTFIQNLNDVSSSLPDLETHLSADSRRSSFASIHNNANNNDRPLSDILKIIKETGAMGIEPRKPVVEIFKFQSMIAALYASYYWGLVVAQDVHRGSESGKGIWIGTQIKLFTIKAGQVQGPSLWSPKGAVDAVGESLIAGVRDLTMKAKTRMSGDGS